MKNIKDLEDRNKYYHHLHLLLSCSYSQVCAFYIYPGDLSIPSFLGDSLFHPRSLFALSAAGCRSYKHSPLFAKNTVPGAVNTPETSLLAPRCSAELLRQVVLGSWGLAGRACQPLVLEREPSSSVWVVIKGHILLKQTKPAQREALCVVDTAQGLWKISPTHNTILAHKGGYEKELLTAGCLAGRVG